MNIALLNMMSDAALKATDRQFSRLLLGKGNIRLHRFTFPEIPRNQKATAYITENYQSEDQIRALHPDAIIITGANASDPRLEIQPFWKPLQKTMAWAHGHTRSTLCSCLSSHAVMQFRFHQRRGALASKIWGVFEHQVVNPDHALAAGLPEAVPVPQSRFNEIAGDQFRDAGLDLIIASSSAGVHLAANQDSSLVLMQGHPEYDAVSLLKEYKREVELFVQGRRQDYPPLPVGILDPVGVAVLEDHRSVVKEALGASMAPPEFPEAQVEPFLTRQWHSAAKQVFANWLATLAENPG